MRVSLHFNCSAAVLLPIHSIDCTFSYFLFMRVIIFFDSDIPNMQTSIVIAQRQKQMEVVNWRKKYATAEIRARVFTATTWSTNHYTTAARLFRLRSSLFKISYSYLHRCTRIIHPSNLLSLTVISLEQSFSTSFHSYNFPYLHDIMTDPPRLTPLLQQAVFIDSTVYSLNS